MNAPTEGLFTVFSRSRNRRLCKQDIAIIEFGVAAMIHTRGVSQVQVDISLHLRIGC